MPLEYEREGTPPSQGPRGEAEIDILLLGRYMKLRRIENTVISRYMWPS